jgi:hypothetical protein
MKIKTLLKDFAEARKRRQQRILYKLAVDGKTRLYFMGFGVYLPDRENAIRYNKNHLPRILADGIESELA